MLDAWAGFTAGEWQNSVNTRDFIQKNYTPYEGDESFLVEVSASTSALWNQVLEGIKQESRTHAPVDFDTDLPSTITSHDAGYINKDLEKIVGLQTDQPLKRAINANGGIRMVKNSCEVYGRELDPTVEKIFTEYRKTHNKACFDLYTKEILACRKSGIITGLPDAYGRGRIIGDYRRIALYGIDFLKADKKEQYNSTQTFLERGGDLEKTLRLREEIADQVQALEDIRQMGLKYNIDMSLPAKTAQEAIQFTYFGYLAAVKSQNGAAMSLGRTSTFLDVYLERDIANGLIEESQAQEMIDHFIMKLRMVRFLRTPEYGSLFSGDPIWATEAMAGMGVDGRTLVSKTTFRYLHTLHTMGAAPEPNMTILWSEQLPEAFKQYAAKVSIDTSSVQYVTALNIIHYSHDRYSYEASLMALMDRDVHHTMACGIAGLSIVADSLAAIKYATVKPVRDEDGIAVDFEIEGDYPKFGNNDARVDDIACDLVERFMKKIQKMHTYREAIPTQSILTITSNVVYGKKTGNTPDGRRAGMPFGPGANPMHGRDEKGAVASLASVSKLPFAYAKDGISYTFSIVPNALGKDELSQKKNLAALMDGYFHHEASNEGIAIEGGQHLNVNVLNREMLLDAVEHPEKYPQLTIRVSGYAVRFNSLTREQQQDVISRTFTEKL